MKKIFLKSVLIFVLILNQTLGSFAFYADVPDTHKYYDSIRSLYDLGRLPETVLFNPDKTLTKPELYQLLLTYAGARLTLDINLPYTDTDNSATYAPYIQTAINIGIIKKPVQEIAFGVDVTVAKHQVLATMFNSLGVGINYFFDKTEFPFADLDPNSGSAPLANKAFELGILEENPEYFKMAKRITKAETVDYLYKIYTYSPTANIAPDTSNNNVISYSENEKELLNNESFATLLDVWIILRNKYLYKDELNDQELIYGAIKGMTEQVSDLYTVFQEPNEANKFITNLSSEYEGIGVVIELIENKVTVISPFKDSPAEKAGILANDIITKVNGESIEGWTIDAVISQIKGPAGTKVKLTILRDTQELNYEIERNFILLKTVESEMKTKSNKNIAYISMLSFNDETYEEFLDAAEDLIDQDPDGFIIDLRNNPGGYMDVSLNIISLFTKEIKTAVSLKYVNGFIEDYKTNGNGLLDGYDIVIIINKGSASASEIMAGALKDFGIATLIGEQSFGKGSVQELLRYPDQSLFKYTVSKWMTPNGKNIDGEGISPHKTIVDDPDDTDDKQLEAALAEF